MTTPSMYSIGNPRLQVAWDATSLKALMTCAYYYKTTIIDGYRGSGVDLEFGYFYAMGAETYKKERLNGKSKQEATLVALQAVLRATWDPITGPWGGSYAEVWRCSGTEPFRNGKGNRAKCPWSHKGVWLPSPGPDQCGTCSSHTEKERRWVPNHKSKHRVSLIRMLLGYLDEQPEDVNGGLYPYRFPDGTPAVELGFRLPLPFQSPSGEPYLLVGYLDSISIFGGDYFITDNKTTTKPLDGKYFSQFSPNIQMDVYDLAGASLYEDLKIAGVLIEGAQVLQSGIRFGMGIAGRDDGLREELLGDLKYWITQAEGYAEKGEWPRNRANCFLCPLKKVCNAPAERREAILNESFEKRFWNPLTER